MVNRKKILINASTVKLSGGLYLTLDIIKVLLTDKDLIIRIVCPDIRSFKRIIGDVSLDLVPKILFRYYFRPILDYFWLLKKIEEFNPDMVLSFSNLPARTNRYQVFYHDNAFMSSKNFSGYNLGLRSKVKHTLRKIFFKNRLKYVNRIIVQTKLEKERLTNLFRPVAPVLILPPMLPFHLSRKEFERYNFPGDFNIRIACLSRYFDHKNIEVLYKTARLLDKKRLPVQLILTIQKDQGSGARQLLKNIKQNDYNKRIFCAGRIPRGKVSAFIQSVDAIILPTLCESYGINCLEAWYHNKPYLISDRKFAHEICGEKAFYFSPSNPESILEVIESLAVYDEGVRQQVFSKCMMPVKLSDNSEIIQAFTRY